jgi:hypothetical protein
MPGKKKKMQSIADKLMTESRQAAKASLITRLLERRFGPLAPKFKRHISEADDARLDILSDMVIDAKTIDEVFALPQVTPRRTSRATPRSTPRAKKASRQPVPAA